MTRRIFTTLALTGTLLFGAAAPAQATHEFKPQGGTWSKDASKPTRGAGVTRYEYGMRASTAPTRVAIGTFQSLLGIPSTGRFDWRTRHHVVLFQRQYPSLPDTGAIDYRTARQLLLPLIASEARRAGIPVGLLCGHVYAESRLDPGAVGRDGHDHGIGQIVKRYGDGTDPWDVKDALRYMANRDAAAIKQYGAFWGPAHYWRPAEARRQTNDALAYAIRVKGGCY